MLKKKTTQLFIGPMSKNCVDACIEFNKNKKNIIGLIASRRQIDSKSLGGGYVNNWTTEKLSKYIVKKKIFLCRDHGGPWQGQHDINIKKNLHEAIFRAKKSIKSDIKNNCKIIHIDTSANLKKKLVEEKLSRTKILLKFASNLANNLKKEIDYEVGWESEKGEMQNYNELKKIIKEIKQTCQKEKIKLPKYITLQTGTKVFNGKNVGILYKNFQSNNKKFKKDILFLKKCIDLCHNNGFRVKEHNADYLNLNFIKLRPKLNIDAINIAPQFGTLETKCIIKYLDFMKMKKEKNIFFDLVDKSKKWEKWVDKPMSKLQKALIAGHYLFSDKKFCKIKKKLINKLYLEKKINLDTAIKKYLIQRLDKIYRSLNLY